MADFDPDSLLTSPPPANASMKVTPVMRQILDHIAGPESGGRYDVVYGGQRVPIGEDRGHPRIAVPIASGPNAGRTSSAFGAFQMIGSTWDWAAEHTGKHDTSPESQQINAAWLADHTYREQTGRDIEKDWASGDPALRAGINRALGTQWEGLAAGPRVSNLDARGRPRFGFSDYARREYEGRPDTDILDMSPADYLDLSPPLEGKPFQNPSGRSLMKSFQRGESIESIPTLNVNVDGTTATVTDQDGRHRALLAKQEGIPSIPVAVQRTGDGTPTEIVGMNGNKRSIEHYQEPQPQPLKEPISLMGQIGQAIMPSAEAAQPDDGVTEEAPPWAVQLKNPPDDGVSEEPPPWAAEQHPSEPQTTLGGLAGAVTRGLAPYAAGAGIGAAVGAPFAGVGAIPGAIAGAASVGAGQLATSLAGLTTPQNLTDKALDAIGERRASTPTERVAESAAGGIANAISGAGGFAQLANTLRNPVAKAVANVLAEAPTRQGIAGGLAGVASQAAAEIHMPPWAQTAAGFLGALTPESGNALRALARGPGKLASEIIGGIGTHTGAEPIKEAFRAGAEGGERSQLFLDQLRGNAPPEQIVDTAKQALDAMRKSRNALYQSGMVDIKNDASQLEFGDLKSALNGVRDAAEYAGKTTNVEAAGKLRQIEGVVRDWESDDPAVFHTPQGFDALKRRIGEIRESTTPHTQARLIVGRAYDAVKNTIVEQAPAYAKVMKDYEDASDALRELESAFSLREKNSIDTALRKLQSVMRNNVNTNYGYRTNLANAMNDLANGRLNPQIAGSALSGATARGLGKGIMGMTGLAGMLHPGAWAALPFESPRAMGEAAYYMGKLRGLFPEASSNAMRRPSATAAYTPFLPTQPTGNALGAMQQGQN